MNASELIDNRPTYFQHTGYCMFFKTILMVARSGGFKPNTRQKRRFADMVRLGWLEAIRMKGDAGFTYFITAKAAQAMHKAELNAMEVRA